MKKVCFLVFAIAFAVLPGSSTGLAQDVRADTPPKAISIPDPVYPKEAMETRFGGDVSVRVAIDKSGNVTSVQDTVGPSAFCTMLKDPRVEAIRKSAVEAAKLAKFEPAVLNGKPVPSATILKYDFVPKGPSPEKPIDQPSEKLVQAGVINGRALSLPKPAYPSAVGLLPAGGIVTVKVLIGEDGNVISVMAASGPPILHRPALEAACGAKFGPTLVADSPVRVSGVITYRFVPPPRRPER